ncbi:MAG: NADH-quinone oxidoreductase subunit 5 family protein [Candidatus Micrarchaeales archaeon]
MFPLISIVPLLVSILLIALLKRESRLIKIIALIGSLTPLLFIPFLGSGSQNITWFSVNGVKFLITTLLGTPNFVLFTLISIIGPLVVLYSFGFMDVMSENRRFYIEILAFQAAMLAFSIAGNFITLFIAWEFLSVTSYLLIGFWNYKENANHAARKTITIILIGDIALLAAIVIFFVTYGTLDFTALIAMAGSSAIGAPVLAALVLVLVAAFTKSAQFPFQEWLSSAMEGPTPVSAFLHSSTMVKAGVFLLIILFPLFESTRLMPIIAIFGGVTALIGISNAIVGTHIKRILAYSTVEELGLMMFAIGIGAYSAALYFFIAQTFYKALLFFYAGNLMKANKTENITEMRNAGRNRILLISGLFGVLALAGFVPFNGFFANVGLESASTSVYTYGFMLFVDLMVSIMIARWFFMPAKKVLNKGIESRLSLSYDSLPRSMTIPVVILAALCLIGAYVAATLTGTGLPVGLGINDAAIETGLVLLGIVAAYFLFYKRQYKEHPKLRVVNNLLGNTLLFDGFYHYVASFGYHIASVFEYFDSELNHIFDSFGRLVSAFGGVVRRIETGSVNAYAIATMIGLAIIVVFVVFT